MRRLVKELTCTALAWSGAAHAYEALRATALPLVLGYHRVVEDMRDAGGIPGMCVTTNTFARHVEWLASRYEVVTLDALAERLRQRRSCAGLAAITFDDGYADVYHNALPVLARLGVPAATFVVADYVGTRRLHLHDRLYLRLEARLRREGAGVDAAAQAHASARCLMGALSRAALEELVSELGGDAGLPGGSGLASVTWSMLRRMQAAGFTIGSHTRTHALLTAEPAERLGSEARGSRLVLERRLGTPVRYFAYPDGAFAPAAVRAIEAAGYDLAFGTCAHRDRRRPHLTVPRRLLWEGSTTGSRRGYSAAVMRCHAAGILRADHCTRPH